jgi:hypothetical protein
MSFMIVRMMPLESSLWVRRCSIAQTRVAVWMSVRATSRFSSIRFAFAAPTGTLALGTPSGTWPASMARSLGATRAATHTVSWSEAGYAATGRSTKVSGLRSRL